MSSASMQDILGFMAVAQTGSFTAAAERLSTNKSSVGKAGQRLEKYLGAGLFQRTTRAVHLAELAPSDRMSDLSAGAGTSWSASATCRPTAR